jgi:hypothetical protein
VKDEAVRMVRATGHELIQSGPCALAAAGGGCGNGGRLDNGVP